jgi:hypothetical protein
VIEQRGIFPKPDCASIMEAQYQSNPICVSGRRLWDQIPKKEDLDHLIQTLEKHYNVSVDLKGKEFVKIQLDWDFENRKVHLSMAPYLQIRKLCDNSTTLFLANAKIRLIHTQNQNTVQNSNSLNMTRVLQSETMNKSMFRT